METESKNKIPVPLKITILRTLNINELSEVFLAADSQDGNGLQHHFFKFLSFFVANIARK